MRMWRLQGVVAIIGVGLWYAPASQAQECAILENTSYTAEVTVRGACRRAFVGGQQVRRLRRSRRCNVSASVPSDLIDPQGRLAANLVLERQVDGVVVEEKSLPLTVRGARLATRVRLRKGMRRSRYVLKATISRPSILDYYADSSGAASEGAAESPEVEVSSCADAQAQLLLEQQAISACTQDADCGQLIPSGCGFTHEIVVRADADTSRYYALQAVAYAGECAGDVPVSTCEVRSISCESGTPFQCVEGVCAWRFEEPADLHESEGDEAVEGVEGTEVLEVEAEGASAS